LIRVLGDFDLAEDAVQEAFAVALQRWPAAGVPDNPGGWIMTAARNKAIDRLRRERRLEQKRAILQGEAEREAEAPAQAELGGHMDRTIPDDRLRLIFTCCHPALAPEAQVALTLRTLGGLTTREIGRAFLVSEPTIAQRLVRAKPERVPPVLAVLYLIFNEGYSATDADRMVRGELCEEAIRLARVLVELMPDEPEASGLLALMLLHHSRRETRLDEGGRLVLLEDQDRWRWDGQAIAEGSAALDRALAMGRLGPYQLQAAIAAEHARPIRAEDTDWTRIATLYAALLRIAPSPVVELNRAVAVAMADGPSVGLALVERLKATGVLDSYHLLHATRADLLRRLGRADEAASAYRRALELATNPVDQAFLRRRLAQVAGPLGDGPGAPAS